MGVWQAEELGPLVVFIQRKTSKKFDYGEEDHEVDHEKRNFPNSWDNGWSVRLTPVAPRLPRAGKGRVENSNEKAASF